MFDSRHVKRLLLFHEWHLLITLTLSLLVMRVAVAQDSPCLALSEYTQRHRQCHGAPLGGGCHQLECNFASNETGSVPVHTLLTVQNCEDPIAVTLHATATGKFEWNHTFFVKGDVEECMLEIPALDASIGTFYYFGTHSRNASHLNFRGYVGRRNDLAFELIPAVEIPLDSRNCTCTDLESASDNFVLPIPGVQHTCHAHSDCSGLRCVTTYSGNSQASQTHIDPCNESIEVTVTDSSGMNLFQQVFHESTSIQVPVAGFSPTLYYLVKHNKFSMTISVIVEVGLNRTLLPEERIVLDRSSCSNLDAFPVFPGSQCDGHPVTYVTRASTRPMLPTTTSKPGGGTRGASLPLGVVVGLPVSLGLLALLFLVITVVVCLCVLVLRKKREVRFRRVVFQRMDDDDDDV